MVQLRNYLAYIFFHIWHTFSSNERERLAMSTIHELEADVFVIMFKTVHAIRRLFTIVPSGYVAKPIPYYNPETRLVLQSSVFSPI